jgi:putative tricarboxylic transport membrane protein
MRLTRDTAGGLFLIAVALVFGVGATQYNFGTLFRMGAGFFPLVISALLGAIGLVLAVSGLRGSSRVDSNSGSGEEGFEFSPRSVAAVLGSLLVFGFALERVGLIVSAFLLVAIAALAEKQSSIVRTLVLAASLAAMAVLIFIEGLGINIALVRWPF